MKNKHKLISIFRIKLRNLSLLCSLIGFTYSLNFAQNLSGSLQLHANQEIKLVGYKGFKTEELAKTTIDASGKFTLIYKDYKGLAYIETADKSQLFLILNEPFINISGMQLAELETIKYSNTEENLIFQQYATEHNQREHALAGWRYLLPQYQQGDLLKLQKQQLSIIQSEISRLEKQDEDFLKQVNKTMYVAWYLPKRKLLDDIPIAAQQSNERIAKHISDFRNMDFNDSKLYNSGILDDLIESHYWLLENGGMSADIMYTQMNVSTDLIISKLAGNDKLLSEVSDFLFALLERRSLFIAAEYLAVKLLTQTSCTLDDNLVKQMEIYRAMKVGNTVPDIAFEGKKLLMGSDVKIDLKLSDLKSDYTLVIFGASWCSKCNEEIPQIKNKYIEWKMNGLETVFISLDTDENQFTNFVKDFPFLSTCDFKSWDNQAVKDFYVFAVPTLFLLNKKREILLRPSSIEHVDTWIKFKTEPKN